MPAGSEHHHRETEGKFEKCRPVASARQRRSESASPLFGFSLYACYSVPKMKKALLFSLYLYFIGLLDLSKEREI
jgi:hypothetical protein